MPSTLILLPEGGNSKKVPRMRSGDPSQIDHPIAFGDDLDHLVMKIGHSGAKGLAASSSASRPRSGTSEEARRRMILEIGETAVVDEVKIAFVPDFFVHLQHERFVALLFSSHIEFPSRLYTRKVAAGTPYRLVALRRNNAELLQHAEAVEVLPALDDLAVVIEPIDDDPCPESFLPVGAAP